MDSLQTDILSNILDACDQVCTNQDVLQQAIEIFRFVAIDRSLQPCARARCVVSSLIYRGPDDGPPNERQVHGLGDEVEPILADGLIQIRIDLLYRRSTPSAKRKDRKRCMSLV